MGWEFGCQWLKCTALRCLCSPCRPSVLETAVIMNIAMSQWEMVMHRSTAQAHVNDWWLIAHIPEVLLCLTWVRVTQISMSALLLGASFMQSPKKYCGSQQEWFTYQASQLELLLARRPWGNSKSIAARAPGGIEWFCVQSYWMPQEASSGDNGPCRSENQAQKDCQALSDKIRTL